MGSQHRVLIANRGEIAIRIARAAGALGIECVAIHPPADALALHARTAATACEIGGHAGDPVAAYLDIDAIIAAAERYECDLLHPGYGFLSESATLAEQCAAAGITFVGPPVAAIALFGDKVRARALARSLGIPVVPGSTQAVATVEAAAGISASLGYPVMLKAAGGGGGRGMRAVANESELAEAFDRCRSEAGAAFGNDAVFIERLVHRPRHIEVQILADAHGTTIHLHDRDCSVQLRNQKVVEIAPAPALDAELRARLQADAVQLVKAAGYTNAGTVEFVVAPETGDYYFIECNPRIQVEHTITEQVTGVDLVQAQFHVASGATLASLGLADQSAVGPPRGFAVQARLVAQSTGTITAYKEPSGPGVRVDACGYLGYAPLPQFDPLLAKVIGSANTLTAAIDRTRDALDEFHIAGIDTNIGQLRAILAHRDVRTGDARTTLLREAPQLLQSGPAATGRTVTFLEERARTVGAGAAAGEDHEPAVDGAAVLSCGPGQQVVRSPMRATVVEVRTAAGADVGQGDVVVVVSAMKMETMLVAPCSGRVASQLALAPGDVVEAGQVVAVFDPGVAPLLDSPVGTGDSASRDASWASMLDEVSSLQGLAADRFAAGSTDPGVVRQRGRNKLTCRERISLLLDDGSFREVGSLAGFVSYDADGAIEAFTPANHVGGRGTIEHRPVIVCADDFTSRGGHADGAIGAKSLYLDRLSVSLLVPSVRLLDGSSGGGSVAAMVPEQKKDGESTAKESSGAITAGRPRVSGGGGSFLPGHLGSSDYTEQLATVPVVNVLLGSVVGIGAAKAVLGHFSVMVRDIAQLFVAGPPVVAHAMGYEITKEDLGDWRVHCRNGSVDNLAETETEACDMTRRFLSYLPTSVFEAPPVLAPRTADPAGRRDDELLDLVPRRRTTTFDMRRAIALIADADSFFEIGSLWGTDQVTGFVRLNGYPMGVIASDSRHVNGGALTADGCDKLRRHIDLCDLFHVPLLNLVDNPGFAVGLEHERAGTIRKGGEWMIAFAQATVPIFTVVMRRSFGVAGNNYATPKAAASVRVVWPAADMGGIPPEGGIEAAYKRQLAEATDPVALRAELNARIESARGPIGPLNRFQAEEMIDPRDTRSMVCDWLPIAYRTISQPARLVSRPLQFRP